MPLICRGYQDSGQRELMNLVEKEKKMTAAPVEPGLSLQTESAAHRHSLGSSRGLGTGKQKRPPWEWAQLPLGTDKPFPQERDLDL